MVEGALGDYLYDFSFQREVPQEGQQTQLGINGLELMGRRVPMLWIGKPRSQKWMNLKSNRTRTEEMKIVNRRSIN